MSPSPSLLPQVPLGSTDIHISRVGLGTVKLGRNQGVKYPTSFSLPTDAEALDLLAHARQLGINLIDTAPAYGTSEERLGEFLLGQRHEWIICSKAGEEFEQGESSYNFSPKHIKHSVERSLRRLKTDYLDIVLLHSDGNDLEAIEQGGLDALAQLKSEGLIRSFGMSTKTVGGGIAAAKQSDCVMATYNLATQDEKLVLDYCAEHGKGVLLKKVLASGHITHQATANLTSGETQDNPLQASMDFVFKHPGVSAAIIGTINPAHVAENVAAAIQACANK
ncbi:aldo/keto reductase [Aurantivibrio plasticivorans]